MRIAVMALLLLACAACKDKQAKKDEPGGKPADPSGPVSRPTLETPSVSGPGLVPATGLGPKITFTKAELKVDEENVATIGPDGLIDKTRWDVLTRLLEAKATSDAPIALTLDATIEYGRVSKLLDMLRRGGFRRLGLLTGTGAQMIPLELPDSAEVNAKGLRPVVTFDRKYVRVWSASGEEGTQKKPKLSYEVGTTPDFKPVTRALAEIVQRRFPGGKRSPEDLTIVVQLDPSVPAETMLQLLAAVRADGSLALFPNIFLAGGI
jgi:biopolymer transport protein ExbD